MASMNFELWLCLYASEDASVKIKFYEGMIVLWLTLNFRFEF